MIHDELLFAARSADIEKIKYFIKNGIDINNIKDPNGNTLLMYVVSRNPELYDTRIEIVKYLLEFDLDLEIRNNNKTNIMDDIVGEIIGRRLNDDKYKNISTYYMKIFSLLVEKGANAPKVEMVYIIAILIQACKYGDINILKYFFNNTSDLNIDLIYYEVYNKKSTMLLYSVEYEHLDIVEYLLENGADVNLSNQSGITPLMRAILTKNIDLIKCILKYDIDINKTDNNGETALVKAAIFDDIEITKLLVGNGANTSILN